jgi:hypothetical protein
MLYSLVDFKMTRANRRANDQWSKTYKTHGRTIGECSECYSPLVHYKGKEYICNECGLIQEYKKKKPGE